jgi:hypothetical protein
VNKPVEIEKGVLRLECPCVLCAFLVSLWLTVFQEENEMRKKKEKKKLTDIGFGFSGFLDGRSFSWYWID